MIEETLNSHPAAKTVLSFKVDDSVELSGFYTQFILYFADVIHYGLYGKRLFKETFYAQKLTLNEKWKTTRIEWANRPYLESLEDFFFKDKDELKKLRGEVLEGKIRDYLLLCTRTFGGLKPKNLTYLAFPYPFILAGKMAPAPVYVKYPIYLSTMMNSYFACVDPDKINRIHRLDIEPEPEYDDRMQAPNEDTTIEGYTDFVDPKKRKFKQVGKSPRLPLTYFSIEPVWSNFQTKKLKGGGYKVVDAHERKRKIKIEFMPEVLKLLGEPG